MQRLLIAALLMGFTTAFTSNNETVYTHFDNPSFESEIQKESIFPNGWSSRTPDNTPDILPGAWKLDISAHSGKTCLGLVTRDDGSSENIGQTLPKALLGNDCYAFSIYLKHADYYVKYDKPCRLRVWGGDLPGQKQVLLSTSPLISHADWKKYEFRFTPSMGIKAITLEAYYAPGISTKYKGNILLDDCSEILKCNKA